MVVHKGTSCESFKRGYVRKNGKNADSYIFVAIYVESLGTVSYSHFIVTLAVSLAISEILSVKE